MRDIKQHIKALELDPEKKYFIIIGRKSGLSAKDLYSFPKSKLNGSMFFLVDDINQIKMRDLDTIQEWIDEQRTKKKQAQIVPESE